MIKLYIISGIAILLFVLLIIVLIKDFRTVSILRKTVREKNKKITKLNVELNETKSKLEIIANHLNNTKKTNTALQKEITRLNSKINELEYDLMLKRISDTKKIIHLEKKDK